MGGRTRPRYPPEYRAELVRLVREEGRSPSELAREFEPSGQSITNWVGQAEIDDGKRGGLTTDEKAELRKLRAENRVLRMEKEILEKAASRAVRPDPIPPPHRRPHRNHELHRLIQPPPPPHLPRQPITRPLRTTPPTRGSGRIATRCQPNRVSSKLGRYRKCRSEVVGRPGLEPGTLRLKVSCSTR